LHGGVGVVGGVCDAKQAGEEARIGGLHRAQHSVARVGGDAEEAGGGAVSFLRVVASWPWDCGRYARSPRGTTDADFILWMDVLSGGFWEVYLPGGDVNGLEGSEYVGAPIGLSGE